MYCENCGVELPEEARFCHKCGKPVDIHADQQDQNHSTRKQFFDGELRKCPNCGALWSSFETVCTSCGYELRGAKTASSTDEFNKGYKSIEDQFVFTLSTQSKRQKKEIRKNSFIERKN